MALPWFRLYAEFATDPVVQTLSFADQRHYVMILCLKCSGVLDRLGVEEAVLDAMVLRSLGLTESEGDALHERLLAVALCDVTRYEGRVTGAPRGVTRWQPTAWDKRQRISDSAAERMRKYRNNKKIQNATENVTVASPLRNHHRNRYGPDTDTDTEKDKEKEKTPKAPKRKAQLARHSTDEARAILEFLNEKTGRDFQPVAANLDLIRARLKEGYPPGKLRQIIACKCRQWLTDDAMRSYLRPSTLFGREKCAQYRGELIPEAQLLAEESLP